MFKINNTVFNSNKSLTEFLNKNIDIGKATVENIDDFCDLVKLDKSFSHDVKMKTLLLFADPKIPNIKIRQFISRTGTLFSPERLIPYLEHKKKNPYDSGSEEFYNLKFGPGWEKVKEKYRLDKKSFYDPVYVAERDGITVKEAEEKVKKFKSKKATSKKGFIARWGQEEGLKRYEKFKETSKHTKAKYITKYGKITGTKKWEEYVQIKKETSVFTVNHWINKGYTPVEAEKLRADFHKENLNTLSVGFWINKGLSEQEAHNKVVSIFNKKQVAFASAPKESLKYFNELSEILQKNNIEFMLGVETSSEKCLYDSKSGKCNFYDFCIPEHNIIIEYHGERYHPNPSKLSEEEWSTWKCISYKGLEDPLILTADQKYELDEEKKQLAVSKGYQYLELWSSNSKEDSWKKINNILTENGIKHEN